MATESFFEDIVIDTPEALARWEAFIKEHPVVKIDPDFVPAPADDPEFFRELDAYLDARKAAREARETTE